jgi:hypothetical protein
MPTLAPVGGLEGVDADDIAAVEHRPPELPMLMLASV